MKRYPRCILGTCCVPWDADYNFAEETFRREVRYLLKRGTRHLYIFGTAGEGYAVSEGQFDRITEVFCEEMRTAGAEPMVGVISLSLTTCLTRIERARQMGVRYFQVSVPAWAKCTFDEIRRFFAETCGRFGDCFFMHYNVARSKRLFTPDEYASLADEFPNFVATKNGSDSISQVVSLLNKAPQLQHFFTECGFATAGLLGLEAGLLISVASVNWETAKLFYQACMEHKNERISTYVSELIDIIKALVRIVGSQGHIDGAYDKMFSKMADGGFPLRLLPPYGYATDKAYQEFVEFVRNKYPHWASAAQ